jgi:hypothetical protein
MLVQDQLNCAYFLASKKAVVLTSVGAKKKIKQVLVSEEEEEIEEDSVQEDGEHGHQQKLKKPNRQMKAKASKAINTVEEGLLLALP